MASIEAAFAAKLNQDRAKDRITSNRDISDNQQESEKNKPRKISNNTEIQPISKIVFIVMLFLAFINDIILGYVVVLLMPLPIIGQIIYLLAYILKFVFSVIIYVWVFLSGNPNYSWKRLLKIFGSTSIEIIPLLGDFLPSYLYLVISTYLNNKKESVLNNISYNK